MLALAFLALFQADALVERLKSEHIAEREEAVRELKKLGKAAVPALEKAAAVGDAEAAGRAKHLLRVIEIQGRLTPEFRGAFPGVEDRLVLDRNAWTRLLLQAGERWTLSDRPYRQLQSKDLEPLAGPAVAGAATAQEKVNVCHVIDAAHLRSAVPGLILYLGDADVNVRIEALGTLGNLDAKAAAPEIRKRLKDENSLARYLAVHALGELGAREAVPDIVPFLKDPEEDMRRKAADALAVLGAKEVVPALLDGLKEKGPDPEKTVRQLGWLGAKEAIPAVRALLKHEGIDVRLEAAWALGRMGSDEGIPLAIAELEHASPRVRSIALRIVAEFEVKDAAPVLVRMLENRGLRVPAARALCRLGSKDGVGAIFEGWGEREREDDGFWLNAVRGREAWDRLRKMEWTDSLEGTGREVLERLAREAGATLEWSPKADGGEPHRLEPGRTRRRSTLLEALADAGSPFGLVLEKDRIRVLEKDESLAFWRAWWEAEKKK